MIELYIEDRISSLLGGAGAKTYQKKVNFVKENENGGYLDQVKDMKRSDLLIGEQEMFVDFNINK